VLSRPLYLKHAGTPAVPPAPPADAQDSALEVAQLDAQAGRHPCQAGAGALNALDCVGGLGIEAPKIDGWQLGRGAAAGLDAHSRGALGRGHLRGFVDGEAGRLPGIIEHLVGGAAVGQHGLPNQVVQAPVGAAEHLAGVAGVGGRHGEDLARREAQGEVPVVDADADPRGLEVGDLGGDGPVPAPGQRAEPDREPGAVAVAGGEPAALQALHALGQRLTAQVELVDPAPGKETQPSECGAGG
jgi:hypothetical protein